MHNVLNILYSLFDNEFIDETKLDKILSNIKNNIKNEYFKFCPLEENETEDIIYEITLEDISSDCCDNDFDSKIEEELRKEIKKLIR